MSKGSLNQVLIVENESGDVYIVENKNKSKKFELDDAQNKYQQIASTTDFSSEEIEEEYLDENFDAVSVDFIDTNEEYEEVPVKILDARKHHEGYKVKTPEKQQERTNQTEHQASKFFCRYCDTNFNDRNEQWMHLCKFLQCNPNNYICRVCCKEVSKKSFDDHVHNEKYECKICEVVFYTLKDFTSHNSNIHKTDPDVPPKKRIESNQTSSNESSEMRIEKPINCLLRRKGVRTKVKYPRKKQRFECDLCGKYLVSSRSLHFHMNLHRGDSSYICASCGEIFYTPNGIKGHSCEKKRRRPEKDFRTYDMRYCRFCDQRFQSLDENKAHKCEFQHPDDPKQVICRCCGKVLAKLAFNRHMETHSGVDWVCSICNRKLATERALKTHLTTHTGNKPYKCSECNETFINKVVLDRHMRFHGQMPKLFRCEYCFKQLSTDTSLKSHVQRLHKNTVQCELCKLEFPNRDYLKDHFQSSHEPSVCGICGKSFSLPRYLKMHEKLHYDDTTVTKMNCSICSKQLTVKNIKHHVYRHHIDQFDLWLKDNPNF